MTKQTTIRALTKLEFAYGLATPHGRGHRRPSPATQEMLGELLGYVEMTAQRASCCRAEHGRRRGDGVWFPDGRPLHAHALAPGRRGSPG